MHAEYELPSRVIRATSPHAAYYTSKTYSCMNAHNPWIRINRTLAPIQSFASDSNVWPAIHGIGNDWWVVFWVGHANSKTSNLGTRHSVNVDSAITCTHVRCCCDGTEAMNETHVASCHKVVMQVRAHIFATRCAVSYDTSHTATLAISSRGHSRFNYIKITLLCLHV
jgi:hypothetical protein